MSASGTERPLGGAMVRSAAMMFGATIATKVFTSIAQLILAALLIQESFALFAWTVALYEGLAIAQKLGFREVLSRRHEELDSLARSCAWMSLGTGTLAGVIQAALAEPLANAYDAPELAPLLWIAAAGAPLRALGVVSEAALGVRMRFGLLARATVAKGLIQPLLSVILAAAGLGAYALVIPLPVVALVGFAMTWRAAGIRFAGGPSFSQWGGILRASGFLFGTNSMYTLVRQGDYLILGFFLSKPIVGVYFFAFSLSTQVATLLAGNLATVLTPGLSRLKDDRPRLIRAFFEAGDTMGYIAMPAAALLAVCAEPLLLMLYKDKWVDAIIPLQILSIAAGVAAVGWLNTTIYAALGRFRLQFITSIIGASSFLGAIAGTAWTGDLAIVCLAVLVQRIAITAFSIGLVTDAWTNSFRFLASILKPSILSAACALPAIACRWAFDPEDSRLNAALCIAAAVVSFGILYHPIGKLALRRTAAQIGKRIRDAIPNRIRTLPGVGLALRLL
ncbi:MAG: oligosaccharide flippase family protein [Phycisphaerales bacterium]